MNLGEHIYQLRNAHNMSQGDLADALEVSRQSVSKWENNSAVPELEKLIKIAQVFGITIDELVTGIPVTAPPSASANEAASSASPHRPGFSAQQIVGIILLFFGGLCLIVFSVVGILIGLWLLGLMIAFPFFLCGTIFMVFKKNVGLMIAWAIYLPIWFVICVLMLRSQGALQYIFSFMLLSCGIFLTIITLRRIKQGRISLPKWANLLLAAAMILLMLITAIFALPPIESNVVVNTDPVVISPIDPSK